MSTKRVVILIIIALGISAIAYAVNYYITFKKPNVTQEGIIFIYKNYGYDCFLDSLKVTGAVDNWKSFIRAASKEKLKTSFKPGRYVIKEGMSNQGIIRTISLNWETPMKYTLRGYTKTLGRLAKTLSNSFEADSATFMEAIMDKELMDSMGFTSESYIGMFIPNTYEFYWTTEPRNVLKRFKKEYDRFWNEERTAKAKEIGFTREEVSNLAAILIGETNYIPEMPRIAGVYINRLHKKMPLQACPTIIYAHLETEPEIRRVLKRHLRVDSPYNTYTHAGLPPGPIAIPTISSIDAVLNYEKTSYIYFCAKPDFDGTHNFATTYSEHMKNARAYSRAYVAKEKERKAKNS